MFFVIIKKKIETYEKRDRSYQSYSWCDLCDCYSQPFLKTASRWVPSLFDSRVRSLVRRNLLVDGVRQSACLPTSSSSLHAAFSIQHMVNRTVLFGSFSVLRHRTSRKSRPIPTKTKKMDVEFITIDFIGSRRRCAARITDGDRSGYICPKGHQRTNRLEW